MVHNHQINFKERIERLANSVRIGITAYYFPIKYADEDEKPSNNPILFKDFLKEMWFEKVMCMIMVQKFIIEEGF